MATNIQFYSIKTDKCLFPTSTDRLTPYRELSLEPVAKAPITEVILGPKNISPVDTVKALLDRCGFNNVKVTNSELSYR